MDNPEREWLEKEGCKTIYIEPGSPWENAYVESFIGKFRDECLNMELFRNVREAQEIADAWKEEYNKRSPHSSLGNLTPKEFAEVHSAATALPSAPPYLQNVRAILSFQLVHKSGEGQRQSDVLAFIPSNSPPLWGLTSYS